MKVTYYGQSSFILEMNGKSLVFDPFISPNPKAASIDVNSLKADYVLLSHGHADHVADAETIAKNNGAKVISNYEIVSWYGEKEVTGHPLNHGGKWKFDFGTVKYVNAIHSSVLPDGTYGGNPGGFVIWDEGKCFYFAGDTALTWDMKLIPMTCPKLDFAILPIGDNFTMGYEDAAIAAEFIDCDKIVACHYDTFGYIEINHDAAKKAFEAKGKELILLDIGQSIDL
ncbi:MAG: metal-dependent hydrolase [Bacteroidetes bacterium]|jgi:L-ascorbate metabolism protein UlaG (beta-lactamase superfamily)|nr:metal-dependent hydrolase [Bacteroidota bacterium]MDF1864155.1 metal-dependent hydrolase [Saprospiraceae bacterium]